MHGCHKIIGAQDNPEDRARSTTIGAGASRSLGSGSSSSPSYVLSRKSAPPRRLECRTCHGAIERMRQVGATTGQSLANDLLNLVGLKPTPRPLTMGWCVECHRRENAAPNVKAPLDCVTCHH